ncbi:MAG: hypothetical protein JNL08_17060 [Planctomycetes bacterium]|nr:hypothetical protein [Planctomycetota bacterium]
MASKKKKKSVAGAGPAAAPPAPSYVRDANVIQKDATTAAERRAVLASALANDWAAADVDTIERIDQDGWHGWAMWPRT